MRVIAGKARRIQLKTIEGLGTRPTTDRIKETLFNMINNDLPGTVFLDLFSGSGAIGIEALSRGAKHACFVENNRYAIECIKENLINTKLNKSATVIYKNVFDTLNLLNEEKKKYNIIFMDPPYNQLLEKEVLIFLSKSDLIDKDSLIIVEASLNTEIDYCNGLGFEIIKEKRYKTNKHYFIKLKDK